MFRLPPTGHPAREAMGELAHVAAVLHPANVGKLPPVWKARREALEFFAHAPAAKAVHTIIIRAETAERWLIRVGRRGGWRKVWNFGAGGGAEELARIEAAEAA